MRRRSGAFVRVGAFTVVALVAAMTFGTGSAHIKKQHAYVGAFIARGIPPGSPAIVWAQDRVVPDSGRVILVGTKIKLTCFAWRQDLSNSGHVFTAFGSEMDGVRYGFFIIDSGASSDALAIYRNASLQDAKTCEFHPAGPPTELLGVGAAAG
jgi:hypothetical protein